MTPAAWIGRAELMQAMLDDGIATRRGVMAIHTEQSYAGNSAILPHTMAATRDALMLPLFPGLTDEQQDYVIDRLASHVTALAA
jgi:perosamine synthetase